MAVAAGTRLGPYVVDSLLGTGGMGEVYRAHDTRLKRDVALKILPPSSASDPERHARFQREAQILASLDHPHIAAIYGIEDADGVTALVLQLVEGDTLADRIARGPMPFDEALPIARQIAEALEAAHEQGIVHRDLKPANVKITPDGHVKVLDFGLAKFSEPGTDSAPARSTTHAAATMSPTITTPALMTGVGVILGTAAYMSPEQAKGRAADKRSDIWAYGCVLYEMLTGQRAFEGDDVAETLAAVIRSEPDWNALPSGLPAALVAALKRCVTKDRRERIGDIAALLFVLRESAAGGQPIGTSMSAASPARSRWRSVASHAAAIVAAGVITSVLWWSFRTPTAPGLVTRFAVALPDDTRFMATVTRIVTISRDGTKIAYQTSRGLHVRSLAEPGEKVFPTSSTNLAFSPDGEWIAAYYPQERAIQKSPTAGGTLIKICDLAESPSGMSWDGDGILFGDRDNGVMRVPASGGKPDVLVRVQPGEFAAAPQLLPDGDSLLFTLAKVSDDRESWTWDRAHVVVHSLKSGRRMTLIEGGSDAHYIATGHLVYAVGGLLFARRFDLRDLKTRGESVPVIEGVRRGAGVSTPSSALLFNPAQLAVAENGTVVFIPGPTSLSLLRQQLAVFNLDGTSVPLKIPAGPYDYPRVSPDGKQIVYQSDEGKDASIWVYDLNGTTSPRRLTLDGRNHFPIWSGDGRWVIFQSDRDGDLGLFRVRADGSSGKTERVTKPDSGTAHVAESSSRDGQVLLFSVVQNAKTTLQMLSLPEGRIQPFSGLLSDRLPNVTFSPDGSRVAYSTRRPNEGRNTLFVEPFPPTGAKHFVAGNDAHMPVWSRDGRDLFFLDPSRTDNGRVGFVAVAVDTRQGFATGQPHLVKRDFRVTGPGIDRPRTFDILPDGRFVGVKDDAQPGDAAAPHLEVVLNWTEELKRALPQK